jgi:hypothetical protein
MGYQFSIQEPGLCELFESLYDIIQRIAGQFIIQLRPLFTKLATSGSCNLKSKICNGLTAKRCLEGKYVSLWKD